MDGRATPGFLHALSTVGRLGATMFDDRFEMERKYLLRNELLRPRPAKRKRKKKRGGEKRTGRVSERGMRHRGERESTDFIISNWTGDKFVLTRGPYFSIVEKRIIRASDTIC